MTSRQAGSALTWPQLPVQVWEPTRDTVHLWTQIVGKTRLALAPTENHWWNVTLYVNSRGLTTSLMPYGDGGLEIVFNFLSHRLDILTTSGQSRSIALEPMSVAQFYDRYVAALDELGISVPIHAVPVELAHAIPFAQDTVHDSYDAVAIRAFWYSMVNAARVFAEFRSRFRGKVSPVHFFWGAFDLAVTRFSGASAPTYPGSVPNCPDSVMHEAYDAQLSSAGFWPGGAEEGAFYSYAYPAPDGFESYHVLPNQAYYDHDLGEFILPYKAVREAADPDELALEFLESTYAAAYDHGHWPCTRNGMLRDTAEE